MICVDSGITSLPGELRKHWTEILKDVGPGLAHLILHIQAEAQSFMARLMVRSWASGTMVAWKTVSPRLTGFFAHLVSYTPLDG